MKVLVTGANGLLGHHVTLKLLNEGYNVRILVRKIDDIYFDINKVELVLGSFEDEEILKRALYECDSVIHIAACVSQKGLNYENYKLINVTGTLLLYQKSLENGVKRFIFISSSNTIGNGTQAKLADEESKISYPFENSFYARSKQEAEQKLLQKTKDSAMGLIIINPCFMIGAFDPKPSSGKLMLMGYKKPIMIVTGGGKNFVSAENVAHVVCNALEKGRSGERYLVAGVNLSFIEFFKHQRKLGGYKQWIIHIPDWALKCAGYVGDMVRKAGIETELCTMNIDQLLVQEYYTGEKAKRELDMKDTYLSESILESLNWFKSTGKI